MSKPNGTLEPARKCKITKKTFRDELKFIAQIKKSFDREMKRKRTRGRIDRNIQKIGDLMIRRCDRLFGLIYDLLPGDET